MLSFRNIYKVLGSLKLRLTPDCSLKCGKFSTGYNPHVLNSNYQSFSLFSTENKKEYYLLEELKNINVNRFSCNLSNWHEIVDEIIQAKTSGKRVPDFLNEDNITLLLKCESKSQRFKYLSHLFKKEKQKFNKAEKQHKKKAELELRRKNAVINDHIQYGLGKNTLVMRSTNRIRNQFYNKRLAHSILFGPKIVIDLSYDEFMWIKEKKDLAAQIAIIHGINKQNYEPYDLYLCNAKFESDSVHCLRRVIPNIDDSLTTLTEQSYLDLFPKENLVYLSPHASEPLEVYDHKATYIIGGFVDTVKKNHISFSKSQEEGIKSYFLPLDEYVLWGCGSKSLSVNQVFSIMQTLRDTGDWKQAFKHIPTRKLRRIQAGSDQAENITDKLFVMCN